MGKGVLFSFLFVIVFVITALPDTWTDLTRHDNLLCRYSATMPRIMSMCSKYLHLSKLHCIPCHGHSVKYQGSNLLCLFVFSRRSFVTVSRAME